jgi:hypothetical protein
MVKTSKRDFRVEKIGKDRYALFDGKEYLCSGSREFVISEKKSYK